MIVEIHVGAGFLAAVLQKEIWAKTIEDHAAGAAVRGGVCCLGEGCRDDGEGGAEEGSEEHGKTHGGG